MPSIALLPITFSVSLLLTELKKHPEIWDLYKERASSYGPHTKISDIWVRYNDRKNLTEDWFSFHNKHESVWYPEADKIPSVKVITQQVYDYVGGKELGGILITKVPPGEMVDPHIDDGWHPRYYEKFAVQIMGNSKQMFCFEDTQLVTYPGQLYTFDNSKVHWVLNGSTEDRITLIICIKR
jgi:hypothetical protein